jgi:hypothetical protein
LSTHLIDLGYEENFYLKKLNLSGDNQTRDNNLICEQSFCFCTEKTNSNEGNSFNNYNFDDSIDEIFNSKYLCFLKSDCTFNNLNELSENSEVN